jgi:lysophospholipase L1-like esterase
VLDTQGIPWAVWEVRRSSDSDIYFSRRTEEAWEPAQPVSADPGLWEESPSLAFAPDGTAWVAWAVSTAEDEVGILVSRWEGNTWSTPVPVLGTSALSGRQPTLAAGPNGDLWLAWIGHDGTDREVYVSHWDGATGGAVVWSAPQRVGEDDTDPLAYDTFPQLAVDDSGEVWLVWVSYEVPTGTEVHASRWDGSTWAPQQQISTTDETPDTAPSLALDVAGNPWVAWQGLPDDNARYWRILASYWDPAKMDWTAETVVSSLPSLEMDEQQPSLAFDADAQLHLTWALWGQRSGIARTARAGSTWATPTWLETEELVEAPVVTSDQDTWIFWLSAGEGGVPISQQRAGRIDQPLPTSLALTPTAPLAAGSAELEYVVLIPLVSRSPSNPTRHFAHGDSITQGEYHGGVHTPYPVVLQQLLNTHVEPSVVFNHGKPGEKARAARARLVQGLQANQPQFVQIMEGTNDITADYDPDQTGFAVQLLVMDARATVPGVKVVVGTITPRKDEKKNEEVEATNEMMKNRYIKKTGAPIADLWQAFYDYGNWEEFYRVGDPLHPDSRGLAIIANTFYETMVDAGWFGEQP